MFYRIFALDVRRSLLGRWKRFSVALLFFVLVTFACKISFSNAYLQSPQLSPFAALTLGDFLLYAFGGCDGVRSASLFGFDRPFAIPFQWLLLILLAIYINFDLTEESLSVFPTGTIGKTVSTISSRTRAFTVYKFF
mgnify:CR=1 FL=1